MPWRDFRDISRDGWGRDYSPGQTIANDAFYIGCLQRIANALETIADRLSPAEQEKLRHKMEQDRDLHEHWRKMEPWYHAEYDAGEALKRRLRPLFDTKARQSMRVGRACHDVVQAERVRMQSSRSDDRYTPADRERLMLYANTVDLASIDWSASGSARTGAFLADYFAKQK